MDTARSPESRRILLVEDEEAHARIIERSFERDAAYQLTLASTVAEGLRALQDSAFELVISDWRLPDGEAFDLFTDSRQFPLLVMTSCGDEKLAVRAIKAGALDYVVKSESSMLDMLHIAEGAIRQRQNAISGKQQEERARELESRNLEIQQADRIKTEFLSAMSHELRTPLHTIIGFSELLLEQLKGLANAAQTRFVHHIHKDAQHLLALVNELLDLSSIEAGKLILQREPLDLNGIVDDASASIRPQCDVKSIRIEADVPASLVIDGDPLRVRQILYNLLGNAVKFTPVGGLIVISVRRTGGFAEISVRDSGIGIPWQEQDAIFDKYHQVAGGKREGTGLGLPIARQLVEGHGGRIWLASEPGNGSCFTFTLPFVSANEESIEDGTDRAIALTKRVNA